MGRAVQTIKMMYYWFTHPGPVLGQALLYWDARTSSDNGTGT
jgi:hypothetical protein